MYQTSKRDALPLGLSSALAALLLAGAFTTAAQAQSASPSNINIENFGRINENYYRGAQPTVDGFRELKQLGVKVVIDLQKRPMREESGWVQQSGMRYYNIPLSDSVPATAAQTEFFLKLVNDPQNWPVYVHCHGGRHRAGEMTAIYRITHDSWTPDKAFTEMKQYGYYSFMGHGSLRDYVYQYYDQFKPARVSTKDPGDGTIVPVGAGK